jgi:peptide/nickel transport system permease protein
MFGYLWPLLPIAGGYGMNIQQGFNLTFILSVLKHSILPRSR